MNYKKTYIHCIISLLIFSTSLAQEIKFELYIKDNCNDTIGKATFYNLRKDDVDFYPMNNDGIVILTERGKYDLSTIFLDEIKLYDFKNFGTIKDTINMPMIRKCLEPTSQPNFVGYCCCNSECEGEQVDYYSNGNKHIEGYFEGGKPIGKLKIYYSNGSLKQVDKYNKKGVLVRSKKYKQKECKD